MSWISQAERHLLLKVKVQPKASKNAHKVEGDLLKVWITAPPTGGKANEALIEYLAKKLKVAKSNISIKSGEKSRNKTVIIAGLSLEDAKERLGC